MGEVADMMLEGDLCAVCGVALDGDGAGIPRLCADCERSKAAPARPVREACPRCGKTLRLGGLSDHLRAKHGGREIGADELVVKQSEWATLVLRAKRADESSSGSAKDRLIVAMRERDDAIARAKKAELALSSLLAAITPDLADKWSPELKAAVKAAREVRRG